MKIIEISDINRDCDFKKETMELEKKKKTTQQQLKSGNIAGCAQKLSGEKSASLHLRTYQQDLHNLSKMGPRDWKKKKGMAP